SDTGGRGEAAFGPLDPGRYTVRVESAGFETATVMDVRVRGGDNRREVKIAIAKLAETVQVGRDARAGASDPRGDAFATVLGQAEIDELPDDPDEMEQLLRDMTGPGAVMRVNGVTAFETKTIVAALPSGFFADSVRKPNDALNTSLRVEHMLTHTQMLRSEFHRSHTTADNLGVGDFDLPERAYSQTRDENVF